MIYYILFFKYFITLNLVLFSFLALFISDLMILWFFLEINNFLFITIIQIQVKKKKMIFMYFIIQIIASFMMIFTIIMNNFFFFNNYLSLLFFLSLLFKLGIPPFHLWLPMIMPFLPWNILFIMLTIQKLIPFYMLSLMNMNTFMFYIVLIMCCIIPPYMTFNKNNFKLIMAYSSMNQAGWMILMIYMKILLWLNYFIFYSMISFPLFWFMNYFKMFMNFKYSPFNTKLNIIPLMLFLNMAGMPPFSFFFMKWFSIYFILYNSNFFLILIMMMLSSLCMLYIYINMTLYSMFIYMYKSKLIFTLTNMPKYFMSFMFISLFMSQILLIT